MQGLKKNFPNARTMIGIKRMGELEKKPFLDVCMQKISKAEWDLKSAEQCSHWQKRIENPQWYPFKIVETNGKCEVFTFPRLTFSSPVGIHVIRFSGIIAVLFLIYK